MQRSIFCNCLYFSANALARSITRLAEEVFAPIGLHPSQAFVLMAIAGKNAINPGELALAIQLKPSTVTRILDQLEKRRLICRRALGRKAVIEATAAGVLLADEARKAWQQLYHGYVHRLGEAPARKLTQEIYAAHEVLSQVQPIYQE